MIDYSQDGKSPLQPGMAIHQQITQDTKWVRIAVKVPSSIRIGSESISPSW